jgi:ABC-type sugar transport system permease subunit
MIRLIVGLLILSIIIFLLSFLWYRFEKLRTPQVKSCLIILLLTYIGNEQNWFRKQFNWFEIIILAIFLWVGFIVINVFSGYITINKDDR